MSGSQVYQGWFSDMECGRTTHRNQIARRILEGMGAEFVTTHVGGENAVSVGGWPKHECDWKCKGSWTAWVTPELATQAYEMADAMQTARGRFNQAQGERAFAQK